MDAMTDEELTRFEFFIRSHISRQKIKELLSKSLVASGAVSALTNLKNIVTDEMAIIVGGITKLFIGEIMEIGKKTSGLMEVAAVN